MSHRPLLSAGDSEGEEIGKGRVAPEAAQPQLRTVKGVVVLVGGVDDDVVVRGVGLDHRPAPLVPPARPAHHLGEKAEGPLGGPVAVHVQGQIRCQHPHQGDIFKIQPLGYHLGAKEDGDLLLFKGPQQLLVSAGGGVRVHPQYLHPGKQPAELLLHLLGAGAHMLHDAAALVAGLLRPLGMAAVVAHEAAVGAVVGHGDAAAGTLRHRAALPAHQHPAAAPAVEKENALLPPPDILLQLPAEDRADGAAVPGPDLLPEIR